MSGEPELLIVVHTFRAEIDPLAPINMVLHCPACGLQHVDMPDDETEALEKMARGERPWDNPPHRSHLCHRCGHIWRPADVPTNGVVATKTKGKNDSPSCLGWVPGRPLTDEQVDRILSTVVPGGSQARDWFLPHPSPRATNNVRDVVRRMCATARVVPPVKC